MKLFGYTSAGRQADNARPLALAEVTLVATPRELRKIARFIASAADAMEESGSSYSHEHLEDRQSGFKRSPHFVVFNPEARN
jgi:hypothetical protein